MLLEDPEEDDRGIGLAADADLRPQRVRVRRDRQPVDPVLPVSRVEVEGDGVTLDRDVEQPDVARAGRQIEIAVVVEVAPRRAGEDGQRRHEQRGGIQEARRALVVPELRGALELLAADEEIGVAVVVVVAPDPADGPEILVEAHRGGDIDVPEVLVVPEQRVEARRIRRLGDEHVDAAVAVEVRGRGGTATAPADRPSRPR